MRSITFYLPLVVMLLLNKGGGRILAEMLVLLIGTAVPIQLAIDSLMRLRAFQPAREVISRVFARLPLALGFSLLVLAVVAAIVTEVILLDDFVCPSNSWVPITLGFVLGITGPVFHRRGRRSINCEQIVAPHRFTGGGPIES